MYIFHAALFSVMTWAHLSGIFTMTWGSRYNRSSRVPMPDWVVVAICASFVGVLLYEIWRRVAAYRRSKAWLRDVASHAPHVPADEAAERIADGMGLDPESFRTLRFERFRRAETQCGHALPWLWIDSAAVELLTSTPHSKRFQFRLCHDLAVAKDLIVGVLLTLGLILILLIATGISMGALPRDAIIAIVAAVATAILGTAAYFAFRKRRTINFIQNRALVLKGDRELHRIQSDSAYIVITRLRYHGRQTTLTENVRWWFFLPGRRPLFADNIPVTSTVWRDDIMRAIADHAHGQHRSACPTCGYPTAGLPSATCPECGTTLNS